MLKNIDQIDRSVSENFIFGLIFIPSRPSDKRKREGEVLVKKRNMKEEIVQALDNRLITHIHIQYLTQQVEEID